jgi:NTE family protein
MSPGMRTGARLRHAVVAALLASGCASTYQPWTNLPLESPAATPNNVFSGTPSVGESGNSSSLVIVVNFSGGGTRAAALAYGVLDRLRTAVIRWEGRDTSLLKEIDVLSGVSGGSVTAAYYAAFGDHLFQEFRPLFLDRDFESDLLSKALEPSSAYRLTSPRFGRGNLLAERLDGLLFHGVTYGDLESGRPHPRLLVTATDLSLGSTFEFTQNQFNLICSRLKTVPLAIAVAASNSVPIVFSPIVLKNNAGTCPVAVAPAPAPAGRGGRRRLEDAESYGNAALRPYVQLVDGGLSDNLGVSRILNEIAGSGGLEHALASGGARGVRKVVFINVDAEHRRLFEIDGTDRVPSVFDVARAMQFGLLTRYTEETSDRFAEEARAWREAVHRLAASGNGPFSQGADLYYIEAGLQDHPDAQVRARLRSIPTSYSLLPKQVGELIQAGHEILDESPEFRRLLADLRRGASAPEAGSRVD